MQRERLQCRANRVGQRVGHAHFRWRLGAVAGGEIDHGDLHVAQHTAETIRHRQPQPGLPPERARFEEPTAGIGVADHHPFAAFGQQPVHRLEGVEGGVRKTRNAERRMQIGRGQRFPAEGERRIADDQIERGLRLDEQREKLRAVGAHHRSRGWCGQLHLADGRGRINVDAQE